MGTATRFVKQIVTKLEENQRHQVRQAELQRLQDDVQQLQGSVDSIEVAVRGSISTLEALTGNRGIAPRLQQQKEYDEEAIKEDLQAASDDDMMSDHALSMHLPPSPMLQPMAHHEGEHGSQEDFSVTATTATTPEVVLPEVDGAEGHRHTPNQGHMWDRRRKSVTMQHTS